MRILLGRLEPGTPEWALAREGRLGGSEVSAALGLSPWCSPFTLWHRKRGHIGPTPESEPMRWGKLLEPVIVAEYARRHPEVVVSASESCADEWRIGAPDADVHDALGVLLRLVEAKTADSNDSWEWGEHGSGDPDAIPPYYRVQCLWYMDVHDVHELTLCVLIGGNDYREYDVPWDEAEAEDVVDRARAFRQTVVDNIRPDIDSSTSTYQTVRELHPDIDGEDVEVSSEVGFDFLATDAALKTSAAEAQLAKSVLLDAMGTARRALVAGTPIARRQPGKNGSVSLYPLHPKDTP